MTTPTPNTPGWTKGPIPTQDRETVYVEVRHVELWRWLPYKADGRRQMKAPGRWQVSRSEYGGWTNATPPEGAEWKLAALNAANPARGGK